MHLTKKGLQICELPDGLGLGISNDMYRQHLICKSLAATSVYAFQLVRGVKNKHSILQRFDSHGGGSLEWKIGKGGGIKIKCFCESLQCRVSIVFIRT